jgi:hypothetical protein
MCISSHEGKLECAPKKQLQGKKEVLVKVLKINNVVMGFRWVL